jgi:hypothetical protein
MDRLRVTTEGRGGRESIRDLKNLIQGRKKLGLAVAGGED